MNGEKIKFMTIEVQTNASNKQLSDQEVREAIEASVKQTLKRQDEDLKFSIRQKPKVQEAQAAVAYKDEQSPFAGKRK